MVKSTIKELERKKRYYLKNAELIKEKRRLRYQRKKYEDTYYEKNEI
jgi:hypothetical protein